jgi:hypothetical protein
MAKGRISTLARNRPGVGSGKQNPGSRADLASAEAQVSTLEAEVSALETTQAAEVPEVTFIEPGFGSAIRSGPIYPSGLESLTSLDCSNSGATIIMLSGLE